MERLVILVSFAFVLTCLHYISAEETVLSSVLTPNTENEAAKLKRQSRSYYDYRYGVPRPIYDRLEYARFEYDRPRCGRCDDRRDDRRDDRDDRDDDYDRRDRYDDDRRGHRPTSGNRYDNKKNYDSDEDRYNDRKGGQKNGTEEENGDKNNSYDDKDSGSRQRGDRDRDRDRGRDRDRDRRRGGDRNRYDDRDRYRPDYYDRFLRDPYRDERRDYYEYERRPLYDRYYPAYEDPGYGYSGYRRQGYDDRGYDDPYGGYGPSAGRGPHDSFRPWDETYRGQAGWDAGGRGYYFASGRPEAGSTAGWTRPEYSRPQDIGYQGLGYSTGHASSNRDPYASSSGYGSGGAGYNQGAGYGQAAAYGQSFAGYGSSSGYGQGSGWHSVGERRPYRDESGVKKLDSRDYNPGSRNQNTHQNSYEQSSRQPPNYGQPANYGQTANYGQNYQQSYSSSSTTPGTSYLFQREDQQVTVKLEETTKQPS